MKPLAEGASVDIEPSGCFRYIFRARGSQKRDRLIDRGHGYRDIACERVLLMSCESVHEPGMCTSQGRLLPHGSTNAMPLQEADLTSPGLMSVVASIHILIAFDKSSVFSSEVPATLSNL
jgi:hypothetical protein